MCKQMKVLLVVLDLAVLSGALSAQFAGGTGTSSDPWLIATRTQLEQLNNFLDAQHTDKYFRQTADIDLGGAPWSPIGRTSAFYGRFDGDGYSIRNLNIADYLGGPSGLFANITEASIENIYLNGVALNFWHDFYSDGGTPFGEVAPLAVYSTNSIITNCHVTGSVNIFAQNGSIAGISGFVGHIFGGEVTRSSSSAFVDVSSNLDIIGNPFINMVGGLAGENTGSIINCEYNGHLNNYTYSVPTGYSGETTDIGGLVGSNSGSIINSKSSGEINGLFSTGGLVGYNSGDVSRCFSTCNVTGLYGVGGFVGVNVGSINESYATGGITASYSNGYGMPPMYMGFGGFVGDNNGTVNRSFSTVGALVQWTPTGMGGFVGYGDFGQVTASYWNNEAFIVTESMGGEGRTTDDMTYPYSDSTYVGWDFSEVWSADTQALHNDGYPFLGWQLQAPYTFFTVDNSSGFEPLTVTFTNKTKAEPNSNNIYLWDFGDGLTSFEQDPQHIYEIPGQYTVSLTVTNEADSSATYTRQNCINVMERIPALNLVSGDALSYGSVFVEENSEYYPVTVSSIGGATVTLSSLHFSGEPLHFELMDFPDSLSIANGQSATIFVRFTPHTVGSIRDTLFIVSDAVNAPVLRITLSGTGLHVLPLAPQVSEISVMDNNVHLSWNAVTVNMHGQPVAPDYYFIYISDNPYNGFTLMALTQSLEYIHPYIGIGAQRMFYRITAVKFYRDEILGTHGEELPGGIRIGMKQEEVEVILRNLDFIENRY